MIEFVIVHSTLQDMRIVLKDLDSEINTISSFNEINPHKTLSSKQAADKFTETVGDTTTGILVLTATGGTEEIIKSLIENVKLPAMIFAVSKKNSLAASLEVYSSLKYFSPLKLFISEDEAEDREAIRRFIKVCNAIKHINSAKFGLVGNPSDWLLSSKNFSGFGKFKTELIKLSTAQIVNKVNRISNDRAKQTFNDIKQVYPSSDVDDSSIVNSGKVYSAMKEIITENNLNSISIRCFDLLEHNYTACMGISMCNDEGIVSGCEGDIPATFSMMIAAFIAGTPCWMANPAVINKKENRITFAHCTVPSEMISETRSSNLTTHMESGLSTANQGKLKHTEVTVLRINSEFNKLLAVTGKIVDSDMRDPLLCRTQAIIRIDGSIEDWISNAVGNHQVIVYGNLINELQDFCLFSGIELILIK